MVFSFFLKRVLRKALTIPLVAGAVYPTLTGDLVVRSLQLKPPKESSKSLPQLSVRKTKVDPYWKTAFEDIVKVESVELEGLVAEIDVADPLTMLHCLYNAKCISPAHFAAQRARLAEALDEQKPGERGDSGRKPLIVKADRFKLTEGEVILHNGAQRLFVEVVEATGTDLMFPLSEQLVSLRADILLRGARDEAGAPVRMLLTWQPQTEVLDVAMTLKNVPLAYLERIFPQLSERATSLLALGGSSTTEGSLSGAVTLVYQATAASGHKWQLK